MDRCWMTSLFFSTAVIELEVRPRSCCALENLAAVGFLLVALRGSLLVCVHNSQEAIRSGETTASALLRSENSSAPSTTIRGQIRGHLLGGRSQKCPGATRSAPYKLLQQIGEGGMGVVFMAEQTEPISGTGRWWQPGTWTSTGTICRPDDRVVVEDAADRARHPSRSRISAPASDRRCGAGPAPSCATGDRRQSSGRTDAASRERLRRRTGRCRSVTRSSPSSRWRNMPGRRSWGTARCRAPSRRPCQCRACGDDRVADVLLELVALELAAQHLLRAALADLEVVPALSPRLTISIRALPSSRRRRRRRGAAR